jgi:hypothetical protein
MRVLQHSVELQYRATVTDIFEQQYLLEGCQSIPWLPLSGSVAPVVKIELKIKMYFYIIYVNINTFIYAYTYINIYIHKKKDACTFTSKACKNEYVYMYTS